MKAIFYLILLPALLPVFVIFFYIYRKDKYEREPIGKVLQVLIMGAIFAPIAGFIERYMANNLLPLFAYETQLQEMAVQNIFGVGLVEECIKLLVLLIFVWKAKEFDYLFDGIVYAASSSLGFAALENILYVINYGTQVSFSRAIFAIPGHAAFGIIMGFFFARAKRASLKGNGFAQFFYMILCIAFPTLIHGLYDFFLSAVNILPGAYGYFIMLVVLIDFITLKMIKRGAIKDRPLSL